VGNNRKRTLAEAPTIKDIQKAWCGVRNLELSGHAEEAQAVGKVIAAFGEVRMLTGAEAYPDNQENTNGS
jgi:hypothetical protein